jgi:hypothetical protein
VERVKYVIAADLGQVNDPTAVAVLKRRLVPVGERYQHTERDPWMEYSKGYYEVRQPVEQHYDLIRLDRVQLRTPYTGIAKGLVKLVQEFYHAHRQEYFQALGIPDEPDQEEPPIQIGLAVDATGVGRAVIDILDKEVKKRIKPGKPSILWRPVVAHGGATTHVADGFFHVPKRDLISAGLIVYQNGRLRVGKLKYRETLEEELRNYRLKQSQVTGHDSYGPLREGQHDDLLFATCLGCWAWERGVKKEEFIGYPNEILFQL